LSWSFTDRSSDEEGSVTGNSKGNGCDEEEEEEMEIAIERDVASAGNILPDVRSGIGEDEDPLKSISRTFAGGTFEELTAPFPLSGKEFVG
jgi:hypothetical protein